THVFHCDGRPMTRMGNSGWYGARKRAGLEMARVHDLKHTFGRRLRAAGVSYEDRQDLLGHRSARMTTHYSAAELSNLIAMAERVVLSSGCESVPLVVLKRRAGCKKSGKTPAVETIGTLADYRRPLKTLVAEEGLEPPTRGL
ncbi:MAG: tyrosine-type recombinase/integrase, partial [Hyphomicrobiaceae bacterium]